MAQIILEDLRAAKADPKTQETRRLEAFQDISGCFCMQRSMTQCSPQHFLDLLTRSVADNMLRPAPLRRPKIGVFSDPSEYLGWVFWENTERKSGLKVCYSVYSFDAYHQVYIRIVCMVGFLTNELFPAFCFKHFGQALEKSTASNRDLVLAPASTSHRSNGNGCPYARQGPVQTQT